MIFKIFSPVKSIKMPEFQGWVLYRFPGAAVTRSRGRGGVNNRNVPFHCSGGHTSGARVWTGWFLLGQNLFQASGQVLGG